MEIINCRINDILPYENNAKKHSDEQVKKIADSIEAFGFNQPLVLDKDNVIIVGHGRYLAAKKLNLSVVPVLIVDISKEQAKAYRLADNKLNESEWDMALVVDELKELSLDMVELTGFSSDLIIEGDEKDDVVPESAPTVAKLGDLWALGRHRLLCGDATKLEDVERLMGGVLADMVFTDPPYNVNYSGRGEKTNNTILNDNMEVAAFDEFLSKTFEAYKTAVKISAPFYICHSSSSQIYFETAMAKTDLLVKNQIIWNKTIASMGWGDYRWKHEPIFYATYGKKDTQFYGDRTSYTVWNESWDIKKIEARLKAIAKKEEKGGSSVWTLSRDTNYEHPTQKPIELLTIAITNSSKADDIILDLFGGSGSTLIACEKTNRICYMSELDPKYCDVIIKRWEDYTGNKAEKLS